MVHDRLNVECSGLHPRLPVLPKADMIARPVRERSAEQVRTMVRNGLQRTGYDG
ncbi:MAG: hypothetical protein R2749_12225 [Acidimicrobiales bacterium]